MPLDKDSINSIVNTIKQKIDEKLYGDAICCFDRTCQDSTPTIYDGEWYINEYFTREVMMKSHHSYLFAQKPFTYRTIRTFLNTGDVKSYRLGRPSRSVTLFEHEEYILMECKHLIHIL